MERALLSGRGADAEVTVVGGGAIGCAVLYHLAEAGYTDLQLVEAGELAGATSSQAAGLVGQVRTTPERTALAMASVALFGRLQRESPWPIDWRQTGSLRIATTPERVAEFDRMVAVARSQGLEVELLGPAEVAELCPVLETGSVQAALWCSTDGYLQPHSLTTGLRQAARQAGATIADERTGHRHRDRGRRRDRPRDRPRHDPHVHRHRRGWAVGEGLARAVGLDLPIVPVRHEYFISEPVDGWRPDLPVLACPINGCTSAPICRACSAAGGSPRR